MKKTNKARLKDIHTRLEAFESLIRYLKESPLLFTNAVKCMEDIKEEADYIIKSMEKLGEYDPKAIED